MIELSEAYPQRFVYVPWNPTTKELSCDYYCDKAWVQKYHPKDMPVIVDWPIYDAPRGACTGVDRSGSFGICPMPPYDPK